MERLGPQHAPALQRLMERSSEFFVLTDGAPAGPSYGADEIVFRAPGKTTDDDTFSLGLFDGDNLIAFAGLCRDFPKPTEWYLGLLLVDPDERGRGLGAQLHREIVDFVAARGCTKLWIAVLEQNVDAERFWKRMGFEEQSRQPYTSQATGYASTAIVMWLVPRSG